MIYLLMALLTYVAWTYIHEYAHLLMTKRFVKVKAYSIKCYPHYHPTLGFVFGSVSYDYEGELTSQQLAWCSFAPRFPDMLGCVLFLYSSNILWSIFFLGGVIDLIRGSLPLRVTSDISRYTRGFGWNLSATMSFQLIFASSVIVLKMI
jgi:hypothetical protein